MVAVDYTGIPVFSWFPQRIERARGCFTVLATPEVMAFVRAPPLPVGSPQVTEPHELQPSVPPPWAVEFLEELDSWEDLLIPEARAEIKNWLRRNKAVYKHILQSAEAGGTPHRLWQEVGKKSGELSLNLSAYVPKVRKLIDAGFLIKMISEAGDLAPQGSEMLPSEKFGYCRDAMLVFALSFAGTPFRDRNLLQTLVIGLDLDADDTPPVIAASPHHRGAREFPAMLRDIVNEEMQAGWITPPTSRPQTIPFRAAPVCVVPKPESENLRNVGDASHPRKDTYASSLGAYYLPPNANCRLGPESLCLWGNPCTVARFMHVYHQALRGSGYQVVATNRDFKSWYRQTPVARRDIWTCGIVLDGDFYSDERMVMGAVPSAHIGHRISALVCLYLLARFDYEWLR